MIETNPLKTNGWILRFSWGWHCTSFKKTAVKSINPGEGVAYTSDQRFGVKSDGLNNAAF